MKMKYLFGAVLCCLVMVACQPNEPDKDTGNDDKTNTEIPEGLNDIVDGIGNIVDTKTIDDGSVVMTDDKGNTITKDKDGNITIVTKDGETIIIDNSIKEDESATKDKWYNTTWKSVEANYPYIDMNYRRRQFVETLREYGFTIEEVNVNKDSTVVVTDNSDEYTLHFKTTTASLQKVSTSTQFTYNRTYHFIRYDVLQNEVGEGDVRYRFVITIDEWHNYNAELYEDHYYYDEEAGSFILMESRGIDGVGLEKYDAIITEEGYDTNNSNEKLLSKDITTTFYNYRRLSDTQIAVSNKSASYILKEDEDSTPELEVYDLEGSHLLSFELVSF